MTTTQKISIEISADKTQGFVHFKDLSYDDFGPTETLHHYKLGRLLESGRVLTMQNGLLDGPAIVNKDYGLFVLGLIYRYHPAIWTVRRGTGFPFMVHTKLVDIGQTSLTLQSRLVNKLDNKELVTLHFKYVYVHRATGRSSPLPDWVVSKYRSALEEKRPIVLSKNIPQVPESCFAYELTVAESDTDHNGHTNQASYVRFCSDAAHAAVKKGRLPTLQPSLYHFPLLELQAMHTGESFMGDKLQVSLWQQEDQSNSIQYVIHRQREDQSPVVFHGSMVFGQSSSVSSQL